MGRLSRTHAALLAGVGRRRRNHSHQQEPLVCRHLRKLRVRLRIRLVGQRCHWRPRATATRPQRHCVLAVDEPGKREVATARGGSLWRCPGSPGAQAPACAGTVRHRLRRTKNPALCRHGGRLGHRTDIAGRKDLAARLHTKGGGDVNDNPAAARLGAVYLTYDAYVRADGHFSSTSQRLVTLQETRRRPRTRLRSGTCALGLRRAPTSTRASLSGPPPTSSFATAPTSASPAVRRRAGTSTPRSGVPPAVTPGSSWPAARSCRSPTFRCARTASGPASGPRCLRAGTSPSPPRSPFTTQLPLPGTHRAARRSSSVPATSAGSTGGTGGPSRSPTSTGGPTAPS